jgi:CHAT domain-containing protein
LAALAAAQQDYHSALRFLTESLAAEESSRDLLFRPGREEEQLEATESRYVSGSYFFFLSLVSRHFKDDPQAVHKGMELVLRRKGIVFDTQSMARASLGEQSHDAQQKREELSAARRELSALLLHKPKAMAEEAYREKLALAFERTSTLEHTLAQALAYRPSLPARTVSDQSITVAAVAAGLPKGAALLEFMKIPDFDYAREDFDFPKREWSASSRYLAFILNQSGKVALVDLGPGGQLEAAAELVFKHMRDRKASEWSRHLTELYTQLWAPLEGALSGVDKVILSPDGSLNLVPFAALIDKEGRFLVERSLVAYANTGRELLATEPPPAPPASDLLLVANPAFDTEASGAPGWSADFRSRDFHQRFDPLGGTQREATEIPPLISATHGQTVLVGTKATEGAVKSVRSPRILHLATHGFFRPDQAFGMDEARYENSLVRSGLALAGANHAARTVEGEDGLLTALEVTGIDLSGTFLVVLSACNTGVGEVKAGEGVVGLRRAFALAGAKNLLMSLWPVGDAITADEMKLFYRNLQTMAPAEALRHAQLDTIRELRARDGHASPQLWAPFILQGGHALSGAVD